MSGAEVSPDGEQWPSEPSATRRLNVLHAHLGRAGPAASADTPPPSVEPATCSSSSSKVRVSALWSYPLKSAKGIAMESMQVLEGGPVNDREWMVVQLNDKPSDDGADAKFITGRQIPELVSIQPSFCARTGNLMLACEVDGVPARHFELRGDQIAAPRTITCKVWNTLTTGQDQGDDAAAFLCACLKEERLRLLRMPAPGRVLKDCPKYGVLAGPADVAKFSDWSPFSIGSEKSLAFLNDHLASPVQMRQFRPNIVVNGNASVLQPFAEETWKTFKVGQVCMRNVKNVARCVMTTLEPQKNGQRHPQMEPLQTLRRLRAGSYAEFLPRDNPMCTPECFFNCNLIHQFVPGQVIRVGDEIEVLETKQPYPSSANNFPLLMTGKDNPFGAKYQ